MHVYQSIGSICVALSVSENNLCYCGKWLNKRHMHFSPPAEILMEMRLRLQIKTAV